MASLARSIYLVAPHFLQTQWKNARHTAPWKLYLGCASILRDALSLSRDFVRRDITELWWIFIREESYAIFYMRCINFGTPLSLAERAFLKAHSASNAYNIQFFSGVLNSSHRALREKCAWYKEIITITCDRGNYFFINFIITHISDDNFIACHIYHLMWWNNQNI